MTITAQIIKCKKCGKRFKWKPYQKPNSTIKPKPPKICHNCKNKDLLSRSDLAGSGKRSRAKPGKYTMRGKNARKLNKKSPKQRAMKRADDWFSRYTRIKHTELIAAGDPLCLCYTCGTRYFAKNIDCGHWQRRGYKATRFDENNARPQCTQCNYHRSGMPEVFEEKLKTEIGPIAVQKLKRNALADFRDSEQFYSEQSDKYRILTNKLIKEKQINKWW